MPDRALCENVGKGRFGGYVGETRSCPLSVCRKRQVWRVCGIRRDREHLTFAQKTVVGASRSLGNSESARELREH